MIRARVFSWGLLLIISLSAFAQEQKPEDNKKEALATASPTPGTGETRETQTALEPKNGTSAALKPVPSASPTPETPSDFDLVLGIGSLIINPSVTDYQVNNTSSVLETTNLGSSSPQLLVGGAFRLPIPNLGKKAAGRFGAQPWYSFVSLKFSPQSSQTFNGYVVGMSYKFSKAFSGLVGFALTPVQEPSPGFRAAAIQVVNQNPNVPVYQRFNVSEMANGGRNAFDGFPIFVQTATGPTTTRVFPGDPTIVHYRGGFVIGVAIPVSLFPKLTSSPNGQK